jgi:hypothetical protein
MTMRKIDQYATSIGLVMLQQIGSHGDAYAAVAPVRLEGMAK